MVGIRRIPCFDEKHMLSPELRLGLNFGLWNYDLKPKLFNFGIKQDKLSNFENFEKKSQFFIIIYKLLSKVTYLSCKLCFKLIWYLFCFSTSNPLLLSSQIFYIKMYKIELPRCHYNTLKICF